MATPAWTPTVADVAKHLRARTRGPSGADLGTFTDATTPTDEQVAGLIDDAVAIVYGTLGAVPGTCAQGASLLAALKTAEMIEISYFPEQVTPGGTVAALRNLYLDVLPAVEACVTSNGAGGGGADGDSTPPSSGFWDVVDYDGSRRGLGWGGIKIGAGGERFTDGDGGYGYGYDGGRWIDGRDPVEIVVRVVDLDD